MMRKSVRRKSVRRNYIRKTCRRKSGRNKRRAYKKTIRRNYKKDKQSTYKKNKHRKFSKRKRLKYKMFGGDVTGNWSKPDLSVTLTYNDTPTQEKKRICIIVKGKGLPFYADSIQVDYRNIHACKNIQLSVNYPAYSEGSLFFHVCVVIKGRPFPPELTSEYVLNGNYNKTAQEVASKIYTNIDEGINLEDAFSIFHEMVRSSGIPNPVVSAEETVNNILVDLQWIPTSNNGHTTISGMISTKRDDDIKTIAKHYNKLKDICFGEEYSVCFAKSNPRAATHLITRMERKVDDEIKKFIEKHGLLNKRINNKFGGVVLGTSSGLETVYVKDPDEIKKKTMLKKLTKINEEYGQKAYLISFLEDEDKEFGPTKLYKSMSQGAGKPYGLSLSKITNDSLNNIWENRKSDRKFFRIGKGPTNPEWLRFIEQCDNDQPNAPMNTWMNTRFRNPQVMRVAAQQSFDDLFKKNTGFDLHTEGVINVKNMLLTRVPYGRSPTPPYGNISGFSNDECKIYGLSEWFQIKKNDESDHDSGPENFFEHLLSLDSNTQGPLYHFDNNSVKLAGEQISESAKTFNLINSSKDKNLKDIKDKYSEYREKLKNIDACGWMSKAINKREGSSDVDHYVLLNNILLKDLIILFKNINNYIKQLPDSSNLVKNLMILRLGKAQNIDVSVDPRDNEMERLKREVEWDLDRPGSLTRSREEQNKDKIQLQKLITERLNEETLFKGIYTNVCKKYPKWFEFYFDDTINKDDYELFQPNPIKSDTSVSDTSETYLHNKALMYFCDSVNISSDPAEGLGVMSGQPIDKDFIFIGIMKDYINFNNFARLLRMGTLEATFGDIYDDNNRPAQKELDLSANAYGLTDKFKCTQGNLMSKSYTGLELCKYLGLKLLATCFLYDRGVPLYRDDVLDPLNSLPYFLTTDKEKKRLNISHFVAPFNYELMKIDEDYKNNRFYFDMDDFKGDKWVFESSQKSGNLLGKGGFGMVYKLSTVNDKPLPNGFIAGLNNIVIKVEISFKSANVLSIKTEQEKVSRSLGEVYKEARMCGDIKTTNKNPENAYVHQNVALLNAVIMSDSHWPIVVMPKCNMGLDTYLYDKNYYAKPGQILKWAHELASGMEYLHGCSETVCNGNAEIQSKFIHRDLKAANIMLDPIPGHDTRYTLRIIDLGTGRYKNVDPDNSDNTLWMTGCGSYLYMAPEILNDEIYDEKVDVFAYSMCLLEMYSNRVPWAGDRIDVAVKKVRDGSRPYFQWDKRYTTYLPGETDAWDNKAKGFFDDLVDRCWVQEGKERPSFTEILVLLETFKKNNNYDEHFRLTSTPSVALTVTSAADAAATPSDADTAVPLSTVRDDYSSIVAARHDPQQDVKQIPPVVNLSIDNVIIDIYSYNQTVYSSINLDITTGYGPNKDTCIAYLNKLQLEESINIQVNQTYPKK